MKVLLDAKILLWSVCGYGLMIAVSVQAVPRQAVRQFWIHSVLKNSLHNEVLIHLKLDSRPESVDNQPWKLVLQQTGQADRIITDDKAIIDIFDEVGQRLLILGEPGSGKTTTLLTLTYVLLTITDADPTKPSPVIFNLSSWAEKQPPLEEWPINELNTRYLMPKKVAEGWHPLDHVGEVGMDYNAVNIREQQQWRIDQEFAILQKLIVGFLQVDVLALVLPSEVLLLPDIRPPLLTALLAGPCFKSKSVRRSDHLRLVWDDRPVGTNRGNAPGLLPAL